MGLVDNPFHGVHMRLVSLLFITLNVGMYSPWWVVAILIILEIVALILSWSPSSE
jgi:hypothetical protein